MSFPQLGYPQYLSASQAVYGGDRPGVLTPSSRGGSAEIGGSASAAAAAVSSVLGMYPYAHNYSAFLPYTSADLALFSQMGSQYDLKDSPGVHPASFAAHTSPAFYPYGQFQYGDPSRPKNATRESTSTLKAWLNERRLKKENKVTWGRSKEDEDANIFGSDNEGDAEKNEDEEEIDLESIDIDKIDDNDGDQSNEEDEEKRGELEAFEKSKSDAISGSKEPSDGNNNNTRVLSPGRQGGFPVPVSNKPKIWSLAETATSPDSLQKPTSPSVPATHPAFLPSHGLYTCQIGKFHNWTNGAFLGQNSLLNVRSFLGVSQHHHNHPVHSQQQQHSSAVASSMAAVNSEKAPEDLSPKHIDREHVLRNESPTQPLKSSFRPLHDRRITTYQVTEAVCLS
uniref:Iroquois homeobox 1a n=1 Tax=Cyprinus carpio TaxID=7962 RepID=A0A8C1SU06_CYPCA